MSIGQTNSNENAKPTGAHKTLRTKNCTEVASLAQKDIDDNKISIFVQGGIAPMVYKSDGVFEKKYELQYFDLGCIGNNCAEVYNQTIFDYLTKTHGKNWIKTIRKDVVGLKKQQTSNK